MQATQVLATVLSDLAPPTLGHAYLELIFGSLTTLPLSGGRQKWGMQGKIWPGGSATTCVPEVRRWFRIAALMRTIYPAHCSMVHLSQRTHHIRVYRKCGPTVKN